MCKIKTTMKLITKSCKYYLPMVLFSMPAYAHAPYVEPYKSWLVIGVAAILTATTFVLLKKRKIILRLIASVAIFAAVFYGGGFVVFISSF